MMSANKPGCDAEEGPEPAAHNRSLGKVTSRSVIWMTMQTVGTRVVNLAGQFFLAWLLLPGDFALFALANAVIALSRQIACAGIREVLVQRSTEYKTYANAGFWISVFTGVVGVGLTLIGAPIAATIFKQPQLTPMIFILAPAAAFSSMAMVSRAALAGNMRFRMISMIQMAAAVTTMVLTVSLAWLGAGPYSFVIPIPIVALSVLAFQWNITRPPIRLSFDLHHWKSLFGDSVKVMLASMLAYVTHQADYLILGFILSDNVEVVGLYFFSYMLSSQVINLITSNIGSVIFAALSSLRHDPERRLKAFCKSTSAISTLGIPLAVIQCAVSAPFISLFFPDRWESAIPIVQVLSIAMGVRLVGSCYYQMLNASARYNANILINLIMAAMFCGLVTIGALVGGGVGAAYGVLACYVLCQLPATAWTLRVSGGKWWAIIPLLGLPGIASMIAVGAPWLICNQLIEGRWLVHLILIPAAALPAYYLIMRLIAPSYIKEVISRVVNLKR